MLVAETRGSPGQGPGRSQGERLLSTVERLVDDCDTLIAQVEAYRSAAGLEPGESAVNSRHRESIARQLIANYSTKSAISGGVTSLPGLLPGVGSALVLLGGALVDVAFTLKYEVEMVLCLTYLYGRDIRDERERWLAYVMAGVHVHEARSGQNYLMDLVEAELDALPRYAPRQLFKLAGSIFGKLALLSASKGLARAIPLVGIVVGASTNKFMTNSVGWWCVDALERRARTAGSDRTPVVDARIR
jgi:hypothetical protein